MSLSRHEKMTAAAVWLAQHGAFVSWGAVSDGKAVNRRWKADMTADPALVPRLLTGSRNSIIVPAGRLLVVDVDKPGWYERLKAQGLPETFTVMSPTVRQMNGDPAHTYRGVHVYLQTPDGFDVTTIPGVFAGGETRRSVHGEQSMVLGPWSMRTDGIYEPLPGCPRTIAEAPMTVLDFLIAHGSESKALITIKADPEGDWTWDSATMGSRHDHLRDRIRFWRGTGLTGQALMDATNAYIERHAIPLDREGGQIDSAEVSRMIKGAEKKFTDDPPTGGSSSSAASVTVEVTDGDQTTTIDSLAVELRTSHPEPFDWEAHYMPIGLLGLLHHYENLTDGGWAPLVLSTCVAMSALFGPVPRLRWSGRDHRLGIFGVMVGYSGFGRKSTTHDTVWEVLEQVDASLPDITTEGFLSGPALVDALDESKTSPSGGMVLYEDELSSLLKVAKWEGNTITADLRKAWDGRRVSTRARKTGITKVDEPFMSFLGGIQPRRLRQYVTSEDIGDGYANRFLWIWAGRRTDAPPSKGDPTLPVSLRDWLRGAITMARTLGGSFLVRPRYTMTLDPAAEARLDRMAQILNDTPPVGDIGLLRQRMPGHIVRLAMVAALLDHSDVVGIDHVAFGEAVAGYAVETIKSVFGANVEDPVAMSILDGLHQVPWMNTTQLRQYVGGKDYTRTKTALRILLEAGLIVAEKRPSGGRPGDGYRLREASGGLSGAHSRAHEGGGESED